MSYEKLGFVKGQKLKADHLNHMEDGIAKAASHYSEPAPTIEIVTSGYVEGDVTFQLDIDGAPLFYKISDLAPSVDDILGHVICFIAPDGSEESIQITYDTIDDMTGYNCYMFVDYPLIVIQNNKFVLYGEECTAPSIGIYAAVGYFDPGYTVKITLSEPVTKIHKDWLPKISTTKFYAFHRSDFSDYLYTSSTPSEANKVNSLDIDKAINEGVGVVIFKVWEDSKDLYSIEYPYQIRPGSAGGYVIYVYENTQYYTSDYACLPS